MTAPAPVRLRCKHCGCGFDDITPLCQGRAVLHEWKPASEYRDPLREFADIFGIGGARKRQ